jgi:DNA invertase Pin-like site-specific DNA recombinase
MLLQYAREHHFPNLTFFVDDGVSGVTYDRPGFQAMLAEIEAERVAVCITKDYCAIIGLNQKDLENQGILA